MQFWSRSPIRRVSGCSGRRSSLAEGRAGLGFRILGHSQDSILLLKCVSWPSCPCTWWLDSISSWPARLSPPTGVGTSRLSEVPLPDNDGSASLTRCWLRFSWPARRSSTVTTAHFLSLFREKLPANVRKLLSGRRKLMPEFLQWFFGTAFSCPDTKEVGFVV